VRLLNYRADQALTVVHDLKAHGYVLGQDFDFSYSPWKWDEMVGDIPRHTDFIFYNSQLATWFSMKYL
jgi:hypothetical protein